MLTTYVTDEFWQHNSKNIDNNFKCNYSCDYILYICQKVGYFNNLNETEEEQ